MNEAEPTRIPQGRPLEMAGLSAGATLRTLLADEERIVPAMLNAAAEAKITVRPIRRNITVLEGSGGNIAVLTGRDGKLLVDAGFGVSRPAISGALRSIAADPIKHLINTHWHTDHTDGNAWLHSEGAAVTAHENTRKRLSVATRVEGWRWTFPAAPAGALPVTVFATEHEMHRNETRIVLKYYSPAHTDSDISVSFTDADVVHVGDTWWNGVYPFIDCSTGGSIDGQIRAAEANLAAITGKSIVIPGHGPVGGSSDIAEFRDHACGDPGKRGSPEETGQVLGRHHSRQTNRRIRRKMGAVPDYACTVHGSRLRWGLTKDGAQIYREDCGNGQPIVFSHGWPLRADAWEDRMV